MAISFNSIPASLRIPGAYIEFDNALAGANFLKQKVIAIGQRLATGSHKTNGPVRVTQADAAKNLFGRGSMLAVMVEAALTANPEIELWVSALADNAAGQAATGLIKVTNAPSGAGTLYLYLGGNRVAVGIASGDSANQVASSIAAAINAQLDLPVTASASAADVTVTARHKGEAFNGYDLRANFYGETQPTGLSLTFNSLSGGTGSPDINDAVDAMGDEWFNWIINPYTDTANMVALETDLDSRYGPMRQIGARAFCAFAGTLGQSSAFGKARNNPHVSCMACGESPTPTFVVASINAAVASLSLSIDPARPLQTLILKGMLAPQANRWTRQERNLSLYDGMSTFTVERDGTCRIERQISMYQTNSSGFGDASYLDINTPETLERIRFEQRALQSQKYPRYKLANDGTNFGAGQAIITPKVWRGELLALYKDMEEKGWVEDYAAYADNLIVERDATDRNRMNWRDTPNLVNQARVFAGKSQFIL